MSFEAASHGIQVARGAGARGRVIQQLEGELACPVVLLAESERGLSAPRNRAIDFARSSSVR